MSVSSPCISICAIDDVSGFCKGCKRTVDEVAAWPYLSDPEKLRLLDKLKERQLPH
jgi:predicted Fe-S protein YdhL (DUF1289 family)